MYDTVRGAGSAALVFLPGVGPWNEGCDGDLQTCTEGDKFKMSDRVTAWYQKWERSVYSLAHHAYRNSNAPDDQVTFNLPADAQSTRHRAAHEPAEKRGAEFWHHRH